MTEPTPAAEPAAAVTPPATEVPAPQGDPAPQDNPLGPNGEKALKAEREARAAAERSAAALQAELDKIAQANMSELEKAQKTAQDALNDAATAKAEALRYRIAAAHGVSTEPGEDDGPSDAEMFLTGTDEASMTAQALRLAARATGSTPPAPRTPAPDPSQGPRSTAPQSEDAEFAQYAAAMRLPKPPTH